MHYRKIMLPTLALSCIGLSACGGGGSSSSDTSTGAAATASGGQVAGSAPAGPLSTGGNAQIMVDASNKLAPIGAHELGVNMAVWYDVTSAGLLQEVQQLSPNIIRWPGGSTSDQYHWQQQTECSIDSNGSYTANGAAYAPNSTFDNFMSDIVTPGGYDAAITVAYGTNAACTGGGDPAEAAAWVAYAKQKGYNQHIHYWTVGNEVFGGWEADMHSTPHDGATYAAAMAGSNGYYAQMKAADPDAQVGAFALAGDGYNNWDQTVLSQAQYDFVEFHWYPEQPGLENDTTLLTQLPKVSLPTVQ